MNKAVRSFGQIRLPTRGRPRHPHGALHPRPHATTGFSTISYFPNHFNTLISKLPPWKWQLSFKILLIGAYIVTAYLVSVEGVVGFFESLFGTDANADSDEWTESRQLADSLLQLVGSSLGTEWQESIEIVKARLLENNAADELLKVVRLESP